MCFIQFSLEKMIEKLLPGHQAEEWGGTTAGGSVGAGEKILQGYFPPPSYWETWVLCSESPWFPVPGVLHIQTHIPILC